MKLPRDKHSGRIDNRTPMKYCNGKPCYDKKGSISAKNKRYKMDHTELRIYHCPICNHWHITSQLRKINEYDDKKIL